MSYTPDETQDYPVNSLDDVPNDRRRFCFEHGYDGCTGEAIECEVIEEKEAA